MTAPGCRQGDGSGSSANYSFFLDAFVLSSISPSRRGAGVRRRCPRENRGEVAGWDRHGQLSRRWLQQDLGRDRCPCSCPPAEPLRPQIVFPHLGRPEKNRATSASKSRTGSELKEAESFVSCPFCHHIWKVRQVTIFRVASGDFCLSYSHFQSSLHFYCGTFKAPHPSQWYPSKSAA